MKTQDIATVCAQLPGVTSDYPFGDQPECFRVGGKIFAQVFPVGVRGALRILFEDESIDRERVAPMVILRCDPAYGDFLREQYPDTVLRPYHSPPAKQPYANTVLTDRMEEAVMLDMIRHAYDVIFHKLPKKKQAEINGAEANGKQNPHT